MRMKLNIRSKLISVFIVLFTIPLLCAAVVFHIYSQGFAREKSLELSAQNMNYVGSSVDLVFSYIYNYSLYVPFEDSYVAFLTEKRDSSSFEKLQRTATDAIILLPYSNSNMQSIRIWRRDGENIKSGTELTMSSEEMEQLYETTGYPIWSYETDGDNTEIYFSRLLKNPGNLQENWGVLKIQLDMQALAADMQNPSEDPTVYYILDQEGTVIYRSMEQGQVREKFANLEKDIILNLTGEILDDKMDTSWYEERGDCYLAAHKITNTGWTLVSVAENSFAAGLSQYMKRIFTAIILICIPACIALGMAFSVIIIAPLKKMGSLMQQIEKENFSVHLKIGGNDELAVLGRQFNHMSDKLVELYERVYVGNIRLKEAQLEELQAKINPHFLYNTLDTIYWMAEFNGTKDVSQMVSYLSKLFRISLSGDQRARIPLSKELEHIQCFLYIEKIRYDDKLEYSIEIVGDELKEHTDDYMVLKLVLQPIVENAVLHGIDQDGSGNINIRIWQEEEILVYEISNTGEADTEHIRRILEDPTYQTKSIGLCNIQQRIQLKYGEEYGITCFNRDGCTVFRVQMPLQKF